MSTYTSSNSQNYIAYNDKQEIEELDTDVWHSYYGIPPDGSTGRHLYTEEPKNYEWNPEPESKCFSGGEKPILPDHSSRFGFIRGKYGYVSGHWPGRYIESEVCSDYDPQPLDCAPERFYSSDHQGPFNSVSQAQIDYEYWKNYGMNYHSWWKYPNNS